MALRATNAMKNTLLQWGLDTFANGAILEIRSGPQPAAARDVATGVLLWSEVLPNPAFEFVDNGVKHKAGTWEALGIAAGTAGWFRIRHTGDTGTLTEADSRLDGQITLPGGGGEMILPDLVITVGQLVTILECTVTI